MSSDTLSVIVLTRNKANYFERCAKAVHAAIPHTGVHVERIVVQNGTDAETESIAARYG